MLHAEAMQIINWIRNAETLLRTGFIVPSSFNMAQQLSLDHSRFQEELEVLITYFFQYIKFLMCIYCFYLNNQINYMAPY